MARKGKQKDDLLYKKDIDDLEKALDYIDKLKRRINKDRRKIRELTKEKNTLQRAWNGAEDYLEDVTDSKPLSELIETSKDSSRLRKTDKTCPRCEEETIKKLLFTTFHIILCENNKCEYRERKNEISSK